jgi:hypothetical protein
LVSADQQHPKAMANVSKSDDKKPPERCQESTFFRPAKESIKETKKYKERGARDQAGGRIPFHNVDRQNLAGASAPLPGKYGRLSQN